MFVHAAQALPATTCWCWILMSTARPRADVDDVIAATYDDGATQSRPLLAVAVTARPL